MSASRVIITDDHDMVRQGLSMFFRTLDEFVLVGEARDGLEAVQICEELQPDVVLMDILMPEMNGIEATARTSKSFPHIKVVALTSFSDDDDLVQRILEAGAIICLPKQSTIDEVADALRAAVAEV